MFAITGITGKVGGEVARTLLAAGQAVRAVLRDDAKAAGWKAQGCEIDLADIEDQTALAAPSPVLRVSSFCLHLSSILNQVFPRPER